MTEPERSTTGEAPPALSTQSRWRTVGFGAAIGLLITVGAVGWWGWRVLAEPIGGSATPVTFKVQPGEGARSIATRLESDGFIRSQLALLGSLKLSGGQFIEGIYYLKRDGSSLQNITPILTGQIAERQITIPEGLRVNEIGQLLERSQIIAAAEFATAARYNPTAVTLPISFNLKSDTFLEGFLFPDTYRLPADATATEIVKRLMETFLKRTEPLPLTYEQLILASIVEREAKFDEDRSLIAGVYANRLKLGMALQADPTVQYAKANAACADPVPSCQLDDWWPTLTAADYQGVESEYNTYRRVGLPPRPITNPGLASMKAVANPAVHDYLYFVSDVEGRAHFATTLAEHNQNKAKYLRQ